MNYECVEVSFLHSTFDIRQFLSLSSLRLLSYFFFDFKTFDFRLLTLRLTFSQQ